MHSKAHSVGKEAKKEITAESTNTTAALPPEAAGSVQRSAAGQATCQENDGFGLSLDHYLNSSTPSITVTVTSASFEAKAESQLEGSEETMVESQAKEKDVSNEATGGTLVQAEVHASLEKKEKEPSSSSGEREDSEWREAEEDENDEDGSRREDYSEGDLVEISAYSGIGEEDSGGSQLDDEDDEEDEEAYQPESSCSEMPGLPEEEEAPPPSRKICFSTDPIKVSQCLLAYGPPISTLQVIKTYILNVRRC